MYHAMPLRLERQQISMSAPTIPHLRLGNVGISSLFMPDDGDADDKVSASCI